MEDIAPQLLEMIQKDFLKILGETRVKQLNYPGAEDYAEEVGAALAEAFRRNLRADKLPEGKMFWNIADRVIRPMLEEDHRLVADAAQQVQQALNQAAGLGLKAQRADLNEDKVSGILNKVAAAPDFEKVAWVLDEPVKTFSRSVVDDTLKCNVDFQGKAGLRPKVIRTAESHCCEWCARLDGVYEYPDVPKDVYRRHERCRCSVEYDPASGKRKVLWRKNDSAQKRTAQEKEEKEQRKINDFIEKYHAGAPEECLPHLEKAEIPASKLSGYALNMEHPTGHAKAVAFRDALGYTIDNETELKNAIKQGLSQWKAFPRAETKYGRPYEVRMLIKGANGKQATVKTAWQIDQGQEFPRLVSAYVYKEKE